MPSLNELAAAYCGAMWGKPWLTKIDCETIEKRMYALWADAPVAPVPKAFWGTADFIKPKEEKAMSKFYIVVPGPTDGIGWDSKDAAREAAELLARENPDKTYYIMEAVEAVSLVKPKVAVTTLKAAPRPRAARKVRKSRRK